MRRGCGQSRSCAWPWVGAWALAGRGDRRGYDAPESLLVPVTPNPLVPEGPLGWEGLKNSSRAGVVGPEEAGVMVALERGQARTGRKRGGHLPGARGGLEGRGLPWEA